MKKERSYNYYAPPKTPKKRPGLRIPRAALAAVACVVAAGALILAGARVVPALLAPKSPPDLSGRWVQVGGHSNTTRHAATITGDTITVNWYYPEDNTTALYWAGTYSAPTSSSLPYTWTSQNDKEQTSRALLASGEDQKAFTYDGKTISYSASALGVTQTIELEKED